MSMQVVVLESIFSNTQLCASYMYVELPDNWVTNWTGANIVDFQGHITQKSIYHNQFTSIHTTIELKFTGSCVLKASAVECQSISPIDPRLTSWLTLHGHPDRYLVDTPPISRLALDRHFINSRWIVRWVSTDSHAWIENKSTHN